MSVIDATKQAARIANTSGLAKDVIDSLEKKLVLIEEQATALEEENTTLLRENHDFRLENNKLKNQIENTRAKGDNLPKKSQDILVYFFTQAKDVSKREAARHFQMELNMMDYHLDLLWGKKLISDLGVSTISGGYGRGGGDQSPLYDITIAGRKYVVENGLAT